MTDPAFEIRRVFISAGASEADAESAVGAIKELAGALPANLPTKDDLLALATKQDLNRLEDKLDRLEDKLDRLDDELHDKLDRLGTRLDRLFYWIIGLLSAFLLTLLGGGVTLFVKLFR
jgi:tetrahydromethanopterin S-methyltransferase subunit G